MSASHQEQATGPAVGYLRPKEWSLGNGQCPECFGHDPQAEWWTEEAGHKKRCGLALALESFGETVFWEQANPTRKRPGLVTGDGAVQPHGTLSPGMEIPEPVITLEAETCRRLGISPVVEPMPPIVGVSPEKMRQLDQDVQRDLVRSGIPGTFPRVTSSDFDLVVEALAKRRVGFKVIPTPGREGCFARLFVGGAHMPMGVERHGQNYRTAVCEAIRSPGAAEFFDRISAEAAATNSGG